jgi:Niemann-Pick C1 protein
MMCGRSWWAYVVRNGMKGRFAVMISRSVTEQPIVYDRADTEDSDALSSNLKRAESIISSCPACKENFFNLFCTFTCSPDQSLFVNVTAMHQASNKKIIVTELDNLWTDKYGSGFYNSCKDVKFGATGGKLWTSLGWRRKLHHVLEILGRHKTFWEPFSDQFPKTKGGKRTA